MKASPDINGTIRANFKHIYIKFGPTRREMWLALQDRVVPVARPYELHSTITQKITSESPIGVFLFIVFMRYEYTPRYRFQLLVVEEPFSSFTTRRN